MIDSIIAIDTGSYHHILLSDISTPYEGVGEIIPYIKNRISFFIAGPPGCGKTTFISKMMKHIGLKHAYLFTSLMEKDDLFSGIKIKRVRMEKDVLETITLDTLRSDSINTDEITLIFDDIDKIRDKTIKKLTDNILSDALANGRAHSKQNKDINIFVTSHALNDYFNTKYTFENCEYVCIFPSCTPFAQVERIVKKVGIDKTQLEKINLIKPKTLIIHKFTPLYLICDNVIEQL